MAGRICSTSAALLEPNPVISWVIVKVCGVSGPGLLRVRGFTMLTFKMENLSPCLKVSPPVQVMASDVPLWPAPCTVTAPAQVPAVCEYSDCSSKTSKPFSRPNAPSLNAIVISSLGWKSEVTGVLMELVCIEDETKAQRFPGGAAFCKSRARASSRNLTEVGSDPKMPTICEVLFLAKKEARESISCAICTPAGSRYCSLISSSERSALTADS